MNKKLTLSILFAGIMGTSTLIHARVNQTTCPHDSDFPYDSITADKKLQEVVVTATRSPKMLKDVPVQTRVITADDIARTDATNIQDLLTQVMPGVEFSYAMNQQTHLNFGGFGGQGVLFLVDGERLAGETMDDTDFNRLLMNNVERIEIVKGAASALYGSNANGGVINIITKKNTEPWNLNLQARYGKHNEQRYSATLGLHKGQWNNQLTASWNDMDNYDVKNGTQPATRVITTIYADRVLNVGDRFSWTPIADKLTLSGRMGYFFRQQTRTADTPERYRDINAGAGMEWKINKQSTLNANYSFDQYDKSEYQRITRLDIRRYSNVQNNTRLLFNHTLTDGHTLTLGADYTHDYLANDKIDGEKKYEHRADVFAQLDYMVSPKLEIVGALRYDYFSDHNHQRLTPKLNIRYSPLYELTLRAGYGMGFRAPTLKEKYYEFDMSGIWIVEGNANLKPEVSHNFNASAEYRKGGYNVTLTGYYNKVGNKLSTAIPYFRSVNDKIPYLPYTNLDDYSVYGADVTVSANWRSGISCSLAYAYTHETFPKDKEGNSINNQYIPARPHSANMTIDYTHRFSSTYALGISLSGRLLSRVENVEYKNYYDVSEGTTTVKYPTYTIWKLSVVQHIHDAIKITLSADNILNYRPKYHYLNSPLTDGIWLRSGISINFR